MSVSLTGPPTGVDCRRLDVARLEKRARRILRALGHARSELSIALVDDAEIAELNSRYRSKPLPTDVLSFSLVEGEHSRYRGGLLGDVVISVETARSQARARHRGLDEEVARLLIHGVLHLIGHDHEHREVERVLKSAERRLWQAVAE
jgi:probable rRNA maturation factor